MKTDSNGCSTCPIGEERYEQYSFRMGQKRVAHVQYDYRHTDGELFSCVKPTLELCRKARDKWIEIIKN